MRTVTVIERPATFVSLDLVKAHVRVDVGDEDALLTLYAAAACASLDGPFGWLGRALGPQTLELREARFDREDWRRGPGWAWDGVWCGEGWRRWPFARRVPLPYPELIAVESVAFELSDGTETTLSPSGWRVEGDAVVDAAPEPWGAEAVRVRYRAGFADAQGDPAVPAAVQAAVLMITAALYANREAEVIDARAVVASNPRIADQLAPYRVLAV